MGQFISRIILVCVIFLSVGSVYSANQVYVDVVKLGETTRPILSISVIVMNIESG